MVWKKRWQDIPPISNDLSDVINQLQDKGFRISIITKKGASYNAICGSLARSKRYPVQ